MRRGCGRGELGRGGFTTDATTTRGTGVICRRDFREESAGRREIAKCFPAGDVQGVTEAESCRRRGGRWPVPVIGCWLDVRRGDVSIALSS